MNPQEIKSIIEKLRKRAQEVKRPCCFDNCGKVAIDSHLLQRKGLLDQISNGTGHVYELTIDHFKLQPFFFKKIGLKDAFTFPGFCNPHDTDLFKEIENGDVNYYDYRTQLLFSYRAAINEKRKKEMNLDSCNLILNSFELQLFLSDEHLESLKLSKEGDMLGIQDQAFYDSIFIKNIKDKSQRDFTFLTYELPRIELCSSGVFTYETTEEMNWISKFKKYKYEEPLTDIFFNLLPMQNKSIVIIGCHKNRVERCWNYIKTFETDNKKLALKKISDLLLCQLENWLCSPSFYNNHLKRTENDIAQIVHESLWHINERRELNFNLFDNIIVE